MNTQPILSTESLTVFQNVLHRAIIAVKVKQYLNMINKEETKEVLDHQTHKAISEFITLAKPFSLEIEGIENSALVENIYKSIEEILKSSDYMKMFHDYYFSGKKKGAKNGNKNC